MKKITAILLILLLAFSLCACKDGEGSGNNNPPVNPPSPPGGQTDPVKPSDPSDPGHNTDPAEFHREDAIQVSKEQTPRFLKDEMAGDVLLTHIDVKSYPNDAQTLLDLAYQALESVYFKANVKAMYEVPLGLAGQFSSFDPVLIETDNAALNEDPLYMVPLQNEDGYKLIGTFFESDVKDNDHISACSDVYNFFINSILSENGLLRSDTQIMFNAVKLSNLKLKPVSAEFADLYHAANERILDFFTGNVISDDGWQNVDADGRCKVDLYGLKSLADVKKWLGEYFTEDIAAFAMAKTDSYIEKNGALWAYPAGIGDNMSVEDFRPKFMAQKDESTAVLLVELTRIEFDSSWDNITGRHFEEYYFELTKTPQGWKFSDYTDVCFGFI